MKKYILVFLVTILGLFANSFDAAVQIAKKENKMIMVEVVVDFCPYCKYMQKNVLSKKETKKAMENYVFVRLNRDEDEIPSYVDSKLTPTFTILDSSGKKVIEMIKGTMEKDDFIEYITEIYKQEKN